MAVDVQRLPSIDARRRQLSTSRSGGWFVNFVCLLSVCFGVFFLSSDQLPRNVRAQGSGTAARRLSAFSLVVSACASGSVGTWHIP